MRLLLPDSPIPNTVDTTPRPGMVYRSRGGTSMYRVILAITRTGSVIFGLFDEEGQLTGTTTYNINYAKELILIAFCPELEDFNLVFGPLPKGE